MKALQLILRLLYLRDRSLSFKLLFFFGILVIAPLTVVGLISYSKSSAVLRQEASQSSWQIIEQVKSHIEYYIRDFEIDSIKMLNQPQMKQLLLMRDTEEVQQSGIRQPIIQLFEDTAYSRSDLSRITLLLDGIMIFDTAGSESVFSDHKLQQEPWYKNTPLNGDIHLVSRWLEWPQRKEPVISIVKQVIHPQTLEPAGMLIMDVNLKRIQEIADKVTVGRSGYLAIIDAEGRYVYHPDVNKLGKPAEDIHQLPFIMARESGYYQKGEEPFYTFSRSLYLNWHLVTVMPSEELTQGVDYIGHTIWLTVLITLVAAYVIAIGFAASIVGPVRRLQYFIKRVKDGNFEARAKVESKDEIGYLTQDFNQMVEKLQELMEEIYSSKLREADLSLLQKETELKVLQAQINPHFLYNALETVRGMALEQGMHNIATLVSSLARLLRYNLNHASQIVPLRDEIAICEMYLRIQQFRFEEKLSYRIDIPEWALEEKIVKFSLQPIVENCVVHGMEPVAQSVMICISAKVDEEGRFVVLIEDSGAGMNEERLAVVQQDLRDKDVIDGGAHIGIANVNRRIRHLLGEDYGLLISSRVGKGTSVKVALPLKGPEEQIRRGGRFIV